MDYFRLNYENIRYPYSQGREHLGLRNAQIGAIHAIGSFFTLVSNCQTAHCGRCEQHFIVGAFTSPTVRFGR